MSISELYENGYTVIPSLISQATCDKIRNTLNSKFSTNLEYNFLKGHYQLGMPDNIDDVPEEILLNKKIHEMIAEVFEKNYYMHSYTCNANAADKNQPYHMDSSHFHSINTIKKFGSPGPPVQIIVNVYIQDTDESNGSFEIVPKSHLFTDFDINEDGVIDEKFVKKSVRRNYPKGSVIIRDKRTWHRGTKNNSSDVRYMIGMGFSLNWYKLKCIRFNPDCEDLLYDAPFSTWNIKYS